MSSTSTSTAATAVAAGTYAIDPSHSHIGFKVRHLVVAKVRGGFSDYTATLQVADEPLGSTVEVVVQLASISTGDEQRDGHLKSADFFLVEETPTMTFRSTGVRPVRDDRFEVTGELTVRGVTRPLVLDATLEGTAADPWGGQRVVFSATGRLNREDFGITWNQALESGGVLVGKDVDIEIEAEFVKQ